MATTNQGGGKARSDDRDPSDAEVSKDAGSKERVPKSDQPTADASLPGRYVACVWDLECVLELHLDSAGRLQGSFSADGEPLLMVIGLIDSHGEVSGLIRAHHLEEIFAKFRARLGVDSDVLEVDVTDVDTGLETAARVLFQRLS